MTMKPKTDKLLIETAESLRAYAQDVRDAHKAGALTPEAAKARLDTARHTFEAVMALIKLEGPDFTVEEVKP